MFSGIVEAKSRVIACARDRGVLRIVLEKPKSFDDLSVGDSVATNGVCLTVEAVDEDGIAFALGAETLRVTGWTEASLADAQLNLERSLRAGDRIHGHFVTGHVDAMGGVLEAADQGGSVMVRVQAPERLAPFVWRKGSWALNGVSLTINDVEDTALGPIVSHCLIPETLRRTNLGHLKLGDRVAIEVDSAARAFLRSMELEDAARRRHVDSGGKKAKP